MNPTVDFSDLPICFGLYLPPSWWSNSNGTNPKASWQVQAFSFRNLSSICCMIYVPQRKLFTRYASVLYTLLLSGKTPSGWMMLVVSCRVILSRRSKESLRRHLRHDRVGRSGFGYQQHTRGSVELQCLVPSRLPRRGPTSCRIICRVLLLKVLVGFRTVTGSVASKEVRHILVWTS